MGTRGLPARGPRGNAVVAQAPATRTDLELLARAKWSDAEGHAREFFVNIIELGPRALRIEAARPLELGSQVVLEGVFPGQRHHGRSLVPLHGIVRKVHVEPKLHYDVELTVLEKESHDRLLEYLERST